MLRNTVVLLDVDGTTIYENGYNQNLLDALKEKNLNKLILFTSYMAMQIPFFAKKNQTRTEVKSYLEKEGFEVLGVVMLGSRAYEEMNEQKDANNFGIYYRTVIGPIERQAAMMPKNFLLDAEIESKDAVYVKMAETTVTLREEKFKGGKETMLQHVLNNIQHIADGKINELIVIDDKQEVINVANEFNNKKIKNIDIKTVKVICADVDDKKYYLQALKDALAEKNNPFKFSNLIFSQAIKNLTNLKNEKGHDKIFDGLFYIHEQLKTAYDYCQRTNNLEGSFFALYNSYKVSTHELSNKITDGKFPRSCVENLFVFLQRKDALKIVKLHNKILIVLNDISNKFSKSLSDEHKITINDIRETIREAIGEQKISSPKFFGHVSSVKTQDAEKALAEVKTVLNNNSLNKNLN